MYNYGHWSNQIEIPVWSEKKVSFPSPFIVFCWRGLLSSYMASLPSPISLHWRAVSVSQRQRDTGTKMACCESLENRGVWCQIWRQHKTKLLTEPLSLSHCHPYIKFHDCGTKARKMACHHEINSRRGEKNSDIFIEWGEVILWHSSMQSRLI